MTYKPMVSYHQALDAPFHSKKDEQRDDILETSKQVKVNPPSWKRLDRSALMVISLKTCALLKEHLKMVTLKRFF